MSLWSLRIFMNRKEEHSMSKYEFSSVFAPYIHRFINAKEAMGFSRRTFEMILKDFDLFFIKEQVETLFITQSLISKWRATQVNCSEKTIYSKYSIIAQFSRYMNHLGVSCFVPRLPKGSIILMYLISLLMSKSKLFLPPVIRFLCVVVEIWTADFLQYLP